MDPNLKKIIYCPVCKKKLGFDQIKDELICEMDRLAFPIKNKIPILLASKARLIDKE